MKRLFFSTTLLVAVIMLGCSPDRSTTNVGSDAPSKASALGSEYILKSEPAESSGVSAVHESAKNEDDITIVGRIGGSANPWVEGRAAFSIVDLAIKSCLECGSDDCPKPWDYC